MLCKLLSSSQLWLVVDEEEESERSFDEDIVSSSCQWHEAMLLLWYVKMIMSSTIDLIPSIL